MAKLNDTQKSNLIADYHTNSFSQRELAKKYGVSLGTVSKITKEIEPKNEHLVNAQMSILSAQSELPNEQMNAIMNTAKDKLYNQQLVTNATQLLMQKTHKFLENGKATKIVTEGQGMGASNAREVKHDLQSSDYKNIADTIDKASVTLGVNSRFNTAIQVNNENNNQVNNNIEDEIIITVKD